MKSSPLVFAPKGDTDLILRKQTFRNHQESLPQAANAAAEEKDVDAEQDEQTELQQPVVNEFKDVTYFIESFGDLKNLKPFNDDGQDVELCYRVSSAHLMLVSPVFKAMLDGPFRESSRNKDGRFEVKKSECSASALLILLDIIHGHHRDVPKTMKLGLLTEMAILVDYYECHEIVEMFAENWIASVIQLNRSTQTGSHAKFLDNLYALLESFWSQDGGCHTEFTAMMLGMLIRQMLSFGLEIPRATERPAVEKSFSQLRDFSRNLKSPLWIGRDDDDDHECTFGDITGPWLSEIDKVDVCCGVKFETFRRRMEDPKLEGRATKKEKKRRKVDRHVS
ncbi:hypothetical protein F25303_9297 [Fusarium sp. NRRL 25303]|nr:hypothetical protein F25303_9297 [Fusarium sp. NRRL 25303]